MKSFILHDVKLEDVKKLFLVSSTVNRTNSTLNMFLNADSITSSNQNSAGSIIKQWSAKYANIAGSAIGDIGDGIKVSIFDGVDFAKKLLGFFGQVATLEFYHDNGAAKQIVIKKVNKEGKVVLKISVNCAIAEISYFAFDAEELQILFGELPDFANNEVFTLTKDAIVSVKKLLALKGGAEQRKYVRLYSKEGLIYATDECFDLALFEDTLGTLGTKKIELDKSIFMSIDDATYTTRLCTLSDGPTSSTELLVLDAVEKSVSSRRTSINLLQDISDVSNGIQWDEFDKDTTFE